MNLREAKTRIKKTWIYLRKINGLEKLKHQVNLYKYLDIKTKDITIKLYPYNCL